VGSFANRAAAVRYAAAMPDVAGARPVPALAEAIPAGIMPLAPRVLWQSPAAGADLRVLPWPGGLALRRQALDPLRQATYDLVQGNEVRTVRAWRVAPLAELPPAAGGVIDVPFIDLTADPPPALDPTASDPDAPEEGETPDPGDPEDVADGAQETAPVADESDPPAPPADDRPAATDGPRWADRGPEAPPEEGLALLRDRPLWPATWADDAAEVRAIYRAATLTLVAGRLGIEPAVVDAFAYQPGDAPPPALVVVELSDRSGRDLGDVRGLGDVTLGLRPEGPVAVEGTDDAWWPGADLGERVRIDVSLEGAVGGEDWQLAGDGGFVRITTADGASWRAVAGELLWSDGRYAVVRDGDELVLVDFVVR